MMYPKFIATILATAVAVTGFTSAPARADADDVAKVLAGIAAIAIIGAAIESGNDRDGHDYNVNRNRNNGHRHNGHRNHTYKNQGRNNGHNTYGHNVRPNDYNYGSHNGARPLPRSVHRKLLPANCRTQAHTRRGNIHAFGSRCLRGQYQYANTLPQQCLVRARGHNGKMNRRVYSSRCLQRFGFQTRRH